MNANELETIWKEETVAYFKVLVQHFPGMCEYILSQETKRMSETFKYISRPGSYEGVSKRFRTESITKYTLTFGITL
jgi:hypothetical protein